MEVQLYLKNLTSIVGKDDQAVAILAERTGTRLCLMYFDLDYAKFIGAALYHQRTVANIPMAHCAFVEMIRAMGWKIDSVRIAGAENGHFITQVNASGNGRTISSYVSPFDCLAFAAGTKCPIVIEESLLVRMDGHVDDEMREAVMKLPSIESISADKATEAAISLSTGQLPQA